jgi:AbrB family looped-hinge helix DNA binding protein
MTEVEVTGELDTKGRVTIPKNVRESLGVGPKDRVRIKVVEGIPRRSFLKECKEVLKGEGNAVELMHRDSPIRAKFGGD